MRWLCMHSLTCFVILLLVLFCTCDGNFCTKSSQPKVSFRSLIHLQAGHSSDSMRCSGQLWPRGSPGSHLSVPRRVSPGIWQVRSLRRTDLFVQSSNIWWQSEVMERKGHRQSQGTGDRGWRQEMMIFPTRSNFFSIFYILAISCQVFINKYCT